MSVHAGAAGSRVAVVGGGLAGLAAAAALGSAGCRVTLFESRRALGGRAASFRDPASGELVDHCQHVSMGCCTNLADFCRRTGIENYLQRQRVLRFIGPDARQYSLQAAAWLPAPLHLVPGFAGLTYLSLAERLGIARAMWKLMRRRLDPEDRKTVGEWLRGERQSAAAREHFWSVILVSALSEELDRASLSVARKVIVDGFLAARSAYVVEIPRVPLATFYGEQLQTWLAGHGVELRLSSPVRQIACDGRPRLTLAAGEIIHPDAVIVTLPWTKLPEVLSDEVAARLPWLDEIRRVEGVPITGVHLWFDRDLGTPANAVIVGRLSQWVFQRAECDQSERETHYYQVVISASRMLGGRDRREIIDEVRRDLAAIWPEAARANLMHARIVTEPGAVFSVRPGLDRCRPAQQTPVPGLFVAGDWTATGWPATMEGAVRSGYLAAEAVLRAMGRQERFLVADLPRGLLARWLIRG